MNMMAAFEAERIDTRASEDQKVWKLGNENSLCDRLVLRPYVTSNYGMTILKYSRKTSQCRIIIARKKHTTLFSPRLVGLANRGSLSRP